MRKLATWFIVLFSSVALFAQNPVLDRYIRTGLESNLSLKQLQLDYSSSLAALKEAKGMFFPDISLNARYTVADGGRVITFPVGDLLNPVYNTLNQLTASDRFPEVENQEFNFYRAKEHETKVSVVQPVFSSDIIRNVKIKEKYVGLAGVNVDRYKRELIKEIKTAYHDYLKAYYMQGLADSTLLLVNENLRVSRALYRNDMVTVDAVYRSEAEVGKVEAERERTIGLKKSASAYFNFLLNRPLESEIEIFNEPVTNVFTSLEELNSSALDGREELEMVKGYIALNEERVKLERGSATPDLFGTVDYGFQGEEYGFTGDDDFVLASMVLRWTLFHGLTNRNRIQQARIEGEKLKNTLEETEQQIRMQVISGYYAVQASEKSIRAAEQRLLSAKKAFRLIDRKYRENQATLLEFIDARNSLTNASSNLIIMKNDYFIRLADLEHVAASLDTTQY